MKPSDRNALTVKNTFVQKYQNYPLMLWLSCDLIWSKIRLKASVYLKAGFNSI